MTDSEKALSLMHDTPNGGLAVKTGKTFEFDAIPCRHPANKKNRTDTYYFKGGLKLRIGWERTEFERV